MLVSIISTNGSPFTQPTLLHLCWPLFQRLVPWVLLMPAWNLLVSTWWSGNSLARNWKISKWVIMHAFIMTILLQSIPFHLYPTAPELQAGRNGYKTRGCTAADPQGCPVTGCRFSWQSGPVCYGQVLWYWGMHLGEREMPAGCTSPILWSCALITLCLALRFVTRPCSSMADMAYSKTTQYSSSTGILALTWWLKVSVMGVSHALSLNLTLSLCLLQEQMKSWGCWLQGIFSKLDGCTACRI